jgi:hypothetical protein
VTEEFRQIDNIGFNVQRSLFGLMSVEPGLPEVAEPVDEVCEVVVAPFAATVFISLVVVTDPSALVTLVVVVVVVEPSAFATETAGPTVFELATGGAEGADPEPIQTGIPPESKPA